MKYLKYLFVFITLSSIAAQNIKSSEPVAEIDQGNSSSVTVTLGDIETCIENLLKQLEPLPFTVVETNNFEITKEEQERLEKLEQKKIEQIKEQ